MPRLVIIDNLPDGTSAVVEDRETNPFWKSEDGHETTELCYLNQSPPQFPFLNILQDKFNFNLSPGAIRFGHSTFPPFSKVKSCYEKHGYRIDEKNYGRHSTTTIDFLVVTKGKLNLITENGTIQLEAGDCVIQKATVHAWVNPSEEVAEMTYFMIGANIPDNFEVVQPTVTVSLSVDYPKNTSITR